MLNQGSLVFSHANCGVIGFVVPLQNFFFKKIKIQVWHTKTSAKQKVQEKVQSQESIICSLILH